MTRPLRSVTALSMAFAALSVPAAEQAAAPTAFVDVAVEDAAGVPVPGLGAADFEILIGGRRARIASLTVNRQPLNLVLLFDVSASVTRRFARNDVSGRIKDSVEEFFVGGLREGERARIGAFASRLALSRGFESDRRLLERALDAAFDHRRETLYGPSPIWDHTYTALDDLAGVSGRKVLVLFTDGRGTGNHRSIEEVVEHAARLGISLHLFGQDSELYIPQDARSAVIVKPGNHLGWIAEVTGGSYVEANEDKRPSQGLADAGVLLQQLLGRLRGTYTVEFEPPVADGDLTLLEVRVKRGNVTIRAPRVFAATARSRVS
jgi:VWFA-related protein